MAATIDLRDPERLWIKNVRVLRARERSLQTSVFPVVGDKATGAGSDRKGNVDGILFADQRSDFHDGVVVAAVAAAE